MFFTRFDVAWAWALLCVRAHSLTGSPTEHTLWLLQALRSVDNSTNPIYVSQGHKLSLETALWVTKVCCRHRIPEPTRQVCANPGQVLRSRCTPRHLVCTHMLGCKVRT